MYRWIVIGGLSALVLVLTACAPKEQAPRESSAEERPDAAPPLESVEAVPPAVETKPDWRARYKVLKDGFAERFVPPSPGSQVSLRMKSGGERSGVLKEITSDAVVLSVPQGSVSLARTALAPATRIQMFEEDFANLRAAERLRLEKAAYEARQQDANKELAQKASATKNKKKSRPSTRNPTPPTNDPVDQSVWQVEAYLKKNLRDPESLQIHQWGTVEQVGEEYSVYCRYSAGGSAFGTTTMNMLFLMRKNGNVYREVPVKNVD